MELTTREAAERLAVNQPRVRALIAAGRLEARRVGAQWLIDADSVDRQAEFTSARATGRAMAPRVAWAAGDLLDGGRAVWLSAADRSRLRNRLVHGGRVEVLRRWLATRASRTVRYRIGEADIDELLHADGVIGTGVSAVTPYGLGLGTGGDADAYVTGEVATRLARDFFLIRSRSGNLTLRIVDHDLHWQTAREVGGQMVAPRLIIGVDLADSRDTRTKSTGRDFVNAVLSEQRAGI